MDILAVYPGIPGLFVAAAYSGTLRWDLRQKRKNVFLYIRNGNAVLIRKCSSTVDKTHWLRNNELAIPGLGYLQRKVHVIAPLTIEQVIVEVSYLYIMQETAIWMLPDTNLICNLIFHLNASALFLNLFCLVTKSVLLHIFQHSVFQH